VRNQIPPEPPCKTYLDSLPGRSEPVLRPPLFRWSTGTVQYQEIRRATSQKGASMSTAMLEESSATRFTTTPGERLRTTMAGVRVSLSWFGVRKSLSREQKAQAADAFGAAGEYVSAAKKLIDTKHPAFKSVTAVRT